MAASAVKSKRPSRKSVLTIRGAPRHARRVAMSPLLRHLFPKDRQWWTTCALLFALHGLWSVASPLLSVPDEPAHVIKAAAVARGQWRSPEAVTPRGPISTVEVPEVFARTFGVPCFAFQPEVDVGCAGPLQGTSQIVPASTSAGRYPPLYYLAVGLPSLAFPSTLGIYLMRLVSSFLSAALLASAFASARRMTRSRFVILGVAVAVTPMVVYLAGSVNPNGLEIAASIALWSSLVFMILVDQSPPTPRIGVRIAIAASTLVLSRPLAPIWFLLIVILVLSMAKRSRLRLLVHSRVAWLSTVPTGMCLLAAGVWVISSGALELVPGSVLADDVSYWEILRTSVGKTGDEVHHMIGTFGWLDTQSPLITLYAWYACLGLLGFAGLAAAKRHQKVVIVGIVLLVVALPRVIEASQVRELGYAWQGRYTLPLAVGLPIIAALLAEDLWSAVRPRLARLLVGSIVVGHIFAFLWALRRYAVGTNGALSPLNWPQPVTALALLAMFTLAATAYGWWLTRLTALDQNVEADGEAGVYIDENGPARPAPVAQRTVS